MNRARLWSLAKRAYVAAVVLLLTWAVYDARGAFAAWQEWLLQPGAYLFVASWMTMAWVLGLAWAWVLRGFLKLRLPVGEWLPIQAAAWAGRYLPGKLGLLAGKLPLLERPGVDWRGLGFSVLFEQLAFVAVGAALVAVLPWPRPLLKWWQSWAPDIPTTAAGLLFAAFILGGGVVALGVLARRTRLPARPSALVSLVILGGYVLAHIVVGLGFFAVLAGQWPGDVAFGPMDAIALLALANLAGIVAVFAPAGIGVREAVIAAGLAAHMPLPKALAIAALLRILTLVADLLFFVLAGGASRLGRGAGR